MAIDWEKYLANGIPKTEAPLPRRKEIRELSPVEMYLFLEGFAKFQQVSMAEPLSYFQLAGIHGLPYDTWPQGNDEIKPRANFKDTTQDFGFGGFCTHSSILFLTWHRPYLALFESALYKHVNEIAAGIDEAQAQPYLEAAQAFRLPYWDWAKREPQSVFPEQALSTYTTYKDGHPTSSASVSHTENPNPLQRAVFGKGVDPDITLIDENGQQYTTTVRYPGYQNAEKSLRETIQKFYEGDSASQTRNLSERVGSILRGYKKFGPMSNNRYKGTSQGQRTTGAATFGSLEDIHNSIHGLVGMGGTMSSPVRAAFDPIFWLHHVNIDRLFAIWQILNQKKEDPDSWVPEVEALRSNFTTTEKTDIENRTSPLYPFRKSVTGKDHWYTSDDVKWVEDFGYTYEETSGLKPEETTADKIQKLETVTKVLYPVPADQNLRSRLKDRSAGNFLLTQAAVLKTIEASDAPNTVAELKKVVAQLPDPPQLLAESLQPSKPLLRQLAPDGHYLEWLVNLKALKHSLGGRYTVSVFLGPVQEESLQMWPFSPNFLGTFYPFGQENETRCAKCQHDQDNEVQVTSQIPLTFALMERYLAGIVPNLTPEGVTPYLTQNLHWRVTLDGQVLADRSQVEGLTVFVISNKVTLPEDESQEPIYDPDVTIYPEITTKLDSDQGRGEGTGLAVGQQ